MLRLSGSFRTATTRPRSTVSGPSASRTTVNGVRRWISFTTASVSSRISTPRRSETFSNTGTATERTVGSDRCPNLYPHPHAAETAAASSAATTDRRAAVAVVMSGGAISGGAISGGAISGGGGI